MAIVLFYTNILIDHTLGIAQATAELSAYDDAAISAISRMETACKLMPAQIAVFDASLADAGIDIIQTTPFHHARRRPPAWPHLGKAARLHHPGHRRSTRATRSHPQHQRLRRNHARQSTHSLSLDQWRHHRRGAAADINLTPTATKKQKTKIKKTKTKINNRKQKTKKPRNSRLFLSN